MKKLEEEYFEATKDVKTSQEIINKKYENFETKERQKEPSINFPTYGRGLVPPGMELNTFMINEKLCEDKAAAAAKQRQGGSGSPQANVQAQQRKRILSPKRQRYETQFEQYVYKKDVEERMEDEPIPVLDFDTTTKPDGTMNAKVQNKIKFEEQELKRIKEEALTKSLKTLEKDATEAVNQEVIVILAKDMLDKLKEVYDQCKEKAKKDLKGQERDQERDQDEVEAEELVHSIAEDEYFENILDIVVRENLDGLKESLEGLLIRMKNTYRETFIQWHTFLGFFSKRGRLRDNEKVNLQLKHKISRSSDL